MLTPVLITIVQTMIASGDPTCEPAPCVELGSACSVVRYATEVVAVTGSYGAPSCPNDTGTFPASAIVLGAPDGDFIQIADNASITLAFTDVPSDIGAIRMFNLDGVSPAAARIEISADGTNFVELLPPGDTLFYEGCPSGFRDIAIDGTVTPNFIRITDHPSEVDCDDAACGGVPGIVGYDLMAVGLIIGCPADISGTVDEINVDDLLTLLGNWSTDGPGAAIAEPCDVVDVNDLLALLSAWGPCSG